MPNTDTKQIIVIRKDIDMCSRGKEIAQGSHAAMAFFTSRLRLPFEAQPFMPPFEIRLTQAEQHWLINGFRKIVVAVNTLDELMDLYSRAEAADITAHYIEDSGETVFNGVPTITALAIGPDWDDLLDPITGHLKLY